MQTNLVSWGTDWNRLSLSLVIALSPTSALASGLAKTDWPTFGGNSTHNKISPSTSKAPLTLYVRTKPVTSLTTGAYVANALAISNGTVYAATTGVTAGVIPPILFAYDLKGNQKWYTKLPFAVGVSRVDISVADDGTIYTGDTKGLNAYTPNGATILVDGCFASNLRAPTIAPDGKVFFITGAFGDIIACKADGAFTYRTNEFPNGGGGLQAGGVAIDSQGNVYYKNSQGVHAVKGLDGSLIWKNCNGPNLCNGGSNNLALSPDEKYLASSSSTITMFDAKSGTFLWRYSVGTDAGVFTFGKNNRMYISGDGDTRGLNGLALGPASVSAIASNYTNELQGRICAVEVPTGRDIWCVLTPDHEEGVDMVVDSNNSVFLGDPTEDAIFALDADGKLLFKYVDKDNVEDRAPAMTDDGKLFYISNYLYGFRPWTLIPKVEKRPSGANTVLKFTVHSSMLHRDPKEGVTVNNVAQVRLDGGVTVPLKYLHQDGDDSVWEGSYTVPAGQDLSHFQVKGTIEAATYQTTTSLETHFANLPVDVPNTGMVQSFDLGTVDKLSGTSAQTTAPAPDDFTQVYQATINWIRDTSLTVWSYLKQSYASLADFVMR